MPQNKIEIRSIVDNVTTDDNGCTVSGKAICFNTPTVLYQDPYDGFEYHEIVSPTALDGCDLTDVPLLYNHDDSKANILARCKDGTLTLDKRDDGLYFTATLNTNLGKDVYTAIKAGDITGCSFGFHCNGDTTENTEEYSLRTITSISELSDISIVDNPAYQQTNVEARSIDELNKQRKDDIQRARLILLTFLS